MPPWLVPGHEPIIVTQHDIHTAHGSLSYEARGQAADPQRR
jgi:hypothetical protein